MSELRTEAREVVAAFSSLEVSPDCPAASPIEKEVLDLFDSVRDSLLRYLTSFYIAPADAEEILQETFLALFRHLQRGRSRRNLRGWLFRVAHNLALRKKNRDRKDSQNISGSAAEHRILDPAPNPEDRLLARQARHRLMAVVAALPEQDRRCLFLRAEGLRYRDIASVLDISLGSVAVSLTRSLSRISRVRGR
jgi:RNA polymerase sigma-70 factor (ECF subfamily)